VTQRFAVLYAVIGAVAIVIALGSVVVYSIREQHAATACGFTPPGREHLPGTGSHADWEWWPLPPGFVCVYTDDGEVVARRRW
jgi:hypothetical protein